MKPLLSFLTSFLVLCLLNGCWDNNELDEYGYVQAISIDQGEGDFIDITTHFYNPSSKMQTDVTSSAAAKGINIRTTGETFFEAMREIPTKFGRKAKWDHMRVIIIGEKLARALNIREVLDFFSRDHEPRGTILPIIAEKSAADFLDIKPFIEQTIGQQYRKMETTASLYSAKTSDLPLYDLAIQLSSPSKTSIMPYLHKNTLDKKAAISGVALIQDGKMVGLLREKDTETLMMLTDRYKYGVFEFPCMNDEKKQIYNKESLEIVNFNSRLVASVNNNKVTVDVHMSIEGTTGELRCSDLKSKQDMERFEQTIKDQVEHQIEHTTRTIKAKKVDVLGIGNQIYRKNPKLWKQLEPDWADKIAQMQFQTHVQVHVLSTGMNAGTIFGTKEH
ncbi:Ger(x)C family spore germination protein [Paenibacillus gorillae]|uniref:Ger(x)C family spore germination protein n=1 Tax=Paenibacillus gorillae TaxID=1243662 RepID=UPI0004B4005C|nr:Ger(x)C family spore germination protein [Paenibacillus gorillae]